MRFKRINWRRMRGAAALAFRLSAAGALALWLSMRIGVALPLWSVLTALIVTQISLGRSLKITLDYFAATVGGVLWGAAVAILVPHAGEASLLTVLMLAIAPPAFIAALYPRFSVGPTTAAIVVLIPQMLHSTPIASAMERVEEVLLGGLTGLLISFILLPSSAFQHARELAAQALNSIARAIPQLFEGFDHGLSEAEAHSIQDGIGQQLSSLLSVTAEAERERPLRITEDPLTGPLFRTLLRLRHDAVIMGRAAHAPLPDAVKAPLLPLLRDAASEAKAALQAAAAALLAKRVATPCDALDTALARYTAEIDALRRAGALRQLPGEAVERIFATGFALEQMRLNLRDLDRCIGEWAARRA
jgi:uncharacterized membrane protein YccC